MIAFTGAVALAAGLRARPPRAGSSRSGSACCAGSSCSSKLNAGVTVAAARRSIALAAAPSPRRAARGAVRRRAARGAGGRLARHRASRSAAIGDYLRGSLEIVSGYSEAMSFEDPLTSLGALGRVPARRARLRGRLARRRGAAAAAARLGLVALWAVLAFTTFKAGFVRHDPAHANIFFASLLGGARRVRLGAAPAADGLAARRAASRSRVRVVAARTPADLLAPGDAREQPRRPGARCWPTAAGPTPRSPPRAHARLGIRAVRRALRARRSARRTVHVEPIDAGLPWAQGPALAARCRCSRATPPTPPASTSATPTRCARPDGPESILREDDRSRSTTATRRSSRPRRCARSLCHFRDRAPPLGRWILLERTAPRCGRRAPAQDRRGEARRAGADPARARRQERRVRAHRRASR